jgi:hypothetical protein
MFLDAEYLSKLRYILSAIESAGGKECCVAGGAIRDMLFEKPIKDIDIFYKETLDNDVLNNDFLNVKEAITLKYEDSGFVVTHPNLQHSYVPVTIQLIQIQTGTVVDTILDFPCSHNNSYLNIKQGLIIPLSVISSYENKTFTVNNVDKDYLKRIKYKYSDWKCISL